MCDLMDSSHQGMLTDVELPLLGKKSIRYVRGHPGGTSVDRSSFREKEHRDTNEQTPKTVPKKREIAIEMREIVRQRTA